METEQNDFSNLADIEAATDNSLMIAFIGLFTVFAVMAFTLSGIYFFYGELSQPAMIITGAVIVVALVCAYGYIGYQRQVRSLELNSIAEQVDTWAQQTATLIQNSLNSIRALEHQMLERINSVDAETIGALTEAKRVVKALEDRLQHVNMHLAVQNKESLFAAAHLIGQKLAVTYSVFTAVTDDNGDEEQTPANWSLSLDMMLEEVANGIERSKEAMNA